MKKGIGKKIFDARNELDMSQTELAKRIGSSYPTITHWEHGKYIPKQDSLKKIAKVLNKPLSYFIEENSDKTASNLESSATENMMRLPLLASIPSKTSDIDEKNIESYLYIPRYLFPGADFVIRYDGNSMHPDIQTGSYCIIRNESNSIDGKTMLLRVGEISDIRRICVKRNKIELTAPNAKTLSVKSRDLIIIGHVIGVWKKHD